jgi:uncharacterized protein
MDFERNPIFKALVGSHNYNLNTPESDKDYKVFVVPTFEDLYRGNTYSKSVIGEAEDHDIHDIRKIVDLFWKANLNFLEVLYSTDFEFYIDNESWFEFIGLRSLIVKMNLPYLYKACKGMFFNKMKYLDKGTEGTIHLVQQYGYDTKQALHAYRILDFIKRFADTSFTDFKFAMQYSDEERENILKIKYGHYQKDKFEKLVADKMAEFDELESLYLSQQPDIKVKNYLDKIVLEIVKMNMEFK